VKRALISILAGAAMLSAPVAYAASTPLAPGGMAGVKAAQNWGGVPVYAWVGGVLVVVGVIAVASNNGNGGHGATTTCSPDGTCPGGGGSGGTGGTSGTH